MKLTRTALARLNDPVTIDVPDFEGMTLQLIPAFAATVIPLLTGDSEAAMTNVCKKAFVGFTGFFGDDGETPEPNTLENRIFLMSSVDIRRTVVENLVELNGDISKGEAKGA